MDSDSLDLAVISGTDLTVCWSATLPYSFSEQLKAVFLVMPFLKRQQQPKRILPCMLNPDRKSWQMSSETVPSSQYSRSKNNLGSAHKEAQMQCDGGIHMGNCVTISHMCIVLKPKGGRGAHFLAALAMSLAAVLMNAQSFKIPLFHHSCPLPGACLQTS